MTPEDERAVDVLRVQIGGEGVDGQLQVFNRADAHALFRGSLAKTRILKLQDIAMRQEIDGGKGGIIIEVCTIAIAMHKEGTRITVSVWLGGFDIEGFKRAIRRGKRAAGVAA